MASKCPAINWWTRKKWYAKNIDRVAKYNKEWSDRNGCSHPSRKKSISKWKKNNRIKVNAHAVISMGIYEGRIKRPDTCYTCFKKCNVEAHHYNYEKQKDVFWMCKSCHEFVHTTIDRIFK